MQQQKVVRLRVNGRVASKVAGLADQANRSLEEMTEILLEDALALRSTIPTQPNQRGDKAGRRPKKLNRLSSEKAKILSGAYPTMNATRKISVVLISSVVLFALLLSMGCSKAHTDAQITTDIQNKIAADSGLAGKPVTVESENNTVTLSGTVDSDAQRDAAVRYASVEAGVKQVVSNIQVGTAPASSSAPIPNRDKSDPGRRRERNRDTGKTNATTADNSQPTYPPASPAQPVSSQPAAPSEPPPPQPVTLATGTPVTVQLVDSIDSEKNQVGDTFRATLKSPLLLDGEVVVPARSNVKGHLVDVKSAGKFAGRSVVVMQLDTVSSGGHSYNLQSSQYTKEGKSRGKDTAIKTGVGAGIGTLIGAIAGGGKGAAIGAAAGGGVGAGSQAVTHSQQVQLPSETVLNFTLQSPLTVTPVQQGPDADRTRLKLTSDESK